nr:IS66 family insertion sequence element accessory protein TnpB [Bradyrhizobium sp. WSM471]
MFVREHMKADPFSGGIYVFRAKRADRIKLIFWDGTGLCLFAKRLEEGVFREQSKPLLDDMHAWLLRERETLSRSSEVLKPINYMIRRWEGFARFLDDGRICLTNNCAERALRGIALGRRNWTFAGSQRGADRAAIMLTMITTCRLNDVDPRAWLADVLARIADLPASRLHELLPWEWKLLHQAGKSDDQQAA